MEKPHEGENCGALMITAHKISDIKEILWRLDPKSAPHRDQNMENVRCGYLEKKYHFTKFEPIVKFRRFS